MALSESELAVIISMIDAEMIDNLLSVIEGQSLSDLLSGVLPTAPEEDIVIEELRCTKFSWREGNPR